MLASLAGAAEITQYESNLLAETDVGPVIPIVPPKSSTTATTTVKTAAKTCVKPA